jgi:hypothetical protein
VTNLIIMWLAVVLLFFNIHSVSSAFSKPNDEKITVTQALEFNERTCLSGAKTSYAAKVTAFFKKLKQLIGIEGELSSTEIRGAVNFIEESIANKENEEIRKCLTDIKEKVNKIFIDINSKNEGRRIILVDSNLHTYGSSVAGEHSRDVLTRILKNNIDGNEARFHQFGTWPGWDNSSDIIYDKPDIVIIHWSAFEDRQQKCKEKNKDIDCSSQFVRRILPIVKGTDAKFIIYSRVPRACDIVNSLVTDNMKTKENFDIKNKNDRYRLYILDMSDIYGRNGSFETDQSKYEIRNLVKLLLGKEEEIPVGYSKKYPVDKMNGICNLH